MTRRALRLAIVLVCSAYLVLPSLAAEQGQVEIKVVIITPDLSLKPVPKHRFQVFDEAGVSVASLTTSFQGDAALDLEGGNYRLVADEVLVFEGKNFEWDVPFEVTAGAVTTLELSNDNADVTYAEVTQLPAPAPVLTEGALYQK